MLKYLQALEIALSKRLAVKALISIDFIFSQSVNSFIQHDFEKLHAEGRCKCELLTFQAACASQRVCLILGQ